LILLRHAGRRHGARPDAGRCGARGCRSAMTTTAALIFALCFALPAFEYYQDCTVRAVTRASVRWELLYKMATSQVHWLDDIHVTIGTQHAHFKIRVWMSMWCSMGFHEIARGR
jgi:hypothetical protein